MLLCCSEAMFKRDMRSVMEEEFPDLSKIGNAVNRAASKAKDIVHKGQEAVEGIKDIALDTFEAAAAKVNQSLKVVGQEVRDLNSTAMKEITVLDEKVRMAQNKAAVFAEGASEVLGKVKPMFDQFLDQLHSVTKMATDVLTGINQEKAVLSLDKAMDSVYATANSWKAAMDDLAEQLQQVSQRLSGHPDPGAPVASNTSNASNSSNLTASLLQSNESLDPITLDDLNKMLKGPMGQLKSVAGKLDHMADEVTGAMGNFVDGTLEVAAQKVPKSLMANVTTVLKGVQAEAMHELEPLGDVGNGIVRGISQAGTDAGLDFGSFGFRSARLPFTLLIGLAMALCGA